MEEFDEKLTEEVKRELAAFEEKCTWDSSKEKDPNYYPCITNFCHECKHQIRIGNN